MSKVKLPQLIEHPRMNFVVTTALEVAVRGVIQAHTGPPVRASAQSQNPGVNAKAVEGCPATITFSGTAVKGAKQPVSIGLEVLTNERGAWGLGLRKTGTETFTAKPKGGETALALAQSFAAQVNKRLGSEFTATVESKPGSDTAVLVVTRKWPVDEKPQAAGWK